MTLFNVRLSRLRDVKKFQKDLSSLNFHYSGPKKTQLVDPELKIQVTQGVQNIQTRVGTPCKTGFNSNLCARSGLTPLQIDVKYVHESEHTPNFSLK